jgi:phosphoglycolate phosphatase
MMSACATYPLPVRAVVIDLDGTLLHTAPDLAEAANRMLVEMGRAPVPVDIVMTYIGNGVDRLIKRVLTGQLDAEPDPALFARAKPIYEKHYDAVVSLYSRPFPGVVEGLQALKAAGFRLACITNKPARFTLPLLKDTGLHDFFELILSGDSLPRTKPDPMPLLHACEVFGIRPQQLLLIGDSSNDARAARAAGCHIFCVPYGYNHGEPVESLDLDRVVSSVYEASRLICKA